MADHTRIALKITNMHCASCAMNIDFALEDLKGVKKAETHFARQVSIIHYESGVVTIDEMIATIKQLGYEATPHEGENAQVQ